MPRISTKNQVTLPVEALVRAGLSAGDDVLIVAGGADQIVITRVPSDPRSAVGILSGVYPAGYLDELRAGERS